MLTFTDQINMYQQITQDYTTGGLVIAKRDINEGGAMFLNRLGRKFNKEYLLANITANQQFYEFPSEVLRISELKVLNGTIYYEPQLVTSEEEWNRLNSVTYKATIPTHYYIRGFNELGLWPTPSAAVTNGISMSYEPQHQDLTQDDFLTGTVTVTNNSITVTHSATGFSANMVGRWIQITDGTDGKWYKIAGFTNTSTLTLENYYEGPSGAGKAFRIGEIMKIPNAYQDAPVYYAAERFYMTQNDQRTAPIFAQRFEMKVKSAKATYGRSTSRMGVKSREQLRSPNWIDLTKPVIYP